MNYEMIKFTLLLLTNPISMINSLEKVKSLPSFIIQQRQNWKFEPESKDEPFFIRKFLLNGPIDEKWKEG